MRILLCVLQFVLAYLYATEKGEIGMAIIWAALGVANLLIGIWEEKEY